MIQFQYLLIPDKQQESRPLPPPPPTPAPLRAPRTFLWCMIHRSLLFYVSFWKGIILVISRNMINLNLFTLLAWHPLSDPPSHLLVSLTFVPKYAPVTKEEHVHKVHALLRPPYLGQTGSQLPVYSWVFIGHWLHWPIPVIMNLHWSSISMKLVKCR